MRPQDRAELIDDVLPHGRGLQDLQPDAAGLCAGLGPVDQDALELAEARRHRSPGRRKDSVSAGGLSPGCRRRSCRCARASRTSGCSESSRLRGRTGRSVHRCAAVVGIPLATTPLCRAEGAHDEHVRATEPRRFAQPLQFARPARMPEKVSSRLRRANLFGPVASR